MADLQRALNYLESGSYDPNKPLTEKAWKYYDSIELDAANQQHSFFSIPQGQGKPKSRTNWKVANQVPNSEHIIVLRLVFRYMPATMLKTDAIMENWLDIMTTAHFHASLHNQSNAIEFPLCEAFDLQTPMKVSGTAVGDQAMLRQQICGIVDLEVELILAAKTTIDFGIDFDVAHNASLNGDLLYLFLDGVIWTLK